MTLKLEPEKKVINTHDWYNFVGQLTDLLPEVHPGGQDATQALLEMCNVQATSRVLDVGCGAGSTACHIAKTYGAQVWGIDLSEVMIAKAKERAQRQGLAEKLEFRLGDVFSFPFDDDTFDVVMLESVLTPLPGDKNQAMKEMVRVLRPGGRIGANEGIVDPESPPELLTLLAKHPAFHGYFTLEALRNLFEASGLEAIEARDMKAAEIPKPRLKLRDLLKFMFQVYPKLLLRLIRDKQIRDAQKVDEAVTKGNKAHLGYALVVGRKPG